MSDVTTTPLRIELDADSVSALLTTPAQPRAGYVFAHGAGAGMNHRFMEDVAHGLAECSLLVLNTSGRSALQIFGAIDAMKLRSCMTLFEAVAPESPVFAQVIDRFHDGQRDPLTLALL